MSGRPRLALVPGEDHQAHTDAVEFARVLAKNWAGALLVARSAEAQQGARLRKELTKLPIRTFAEAAGVSHPTVRRYLDAWERAADDGLVPHAAELEPGQTVDLAVAKARSWDDYYSAGREHGERRLGVHFSSEMDNWATPQDFFDVLDAEFNFDLDVCALPSSAKCGRYFAPGDDGLSQEWQDVCWMNPPYGTEIGRWVQKAWESGQAGATVVCLLPARTDTNGG